LSLYCRADRIHWTPSTRPPRPSAVHTCASSARTAQLARADIVRRCTSFHRSPNCRLWRCCRHLRPRHLYRRRPPWKGFRRLHHSRLKLYHPRTQLRPRSLCQQRTNCQPPTLLRRFHRSHQSRLKLYHLRTQLRPWSLCPQRTSCQPPTLLRRFHRSHQSRLKVYHLRTQLRPWSLCPQRTSCQPSTFFLRFHRDPCPSNHQRYFRCRCLLEVGHCNPAKHPPKRPRVSPICLDYCVRTWSASP